MGVALDRGSERAGQACWSVSAASRGCSAETVPPPPADQRQDPQNGGWLLSCRGRRCLFCPAPSRPFSTDISCGGLHLPPQGPGPRWVNEPVSREPGPHAAWGRYTPTAARLQTRSPTCPSLSCPGAWLPALVLHSSSCPCLLPLSAHLLHRSARLGLCCL